MSSVNPANQETAVMNQPTALETLILMAYKSAQLSTGMHFFRSDADGCAQRRMKPNTPNHSALIPDHMIKTKHSVLPKSAEYPSLLIPHVIQRSWHQRWTSMHCVTHHTCGVDRAWRTNAHIETHLLKLQIWPKLRCLSIIEWFITGIVTHTHTHTHTHVYLAI